MQARDACEATRELAPELALGIADGEDCADALVHLAACAHCRSRLAELADVADELLALAPALEPPLGFETGVVAAIGHAPEEASSSARPRRSWLHRRRLALASAAAAVLAAAVAAAGLLVAFQGDRELASQYRAALARVNGEYFEAARLYDGKGTAVGKVFGYQGNPSWLLVLVYAPYRHASFTGTLVTRDGASIPLAALDIDATEGSWGGAIPVDFRALALVRLTDEDGHVYRGLLPEAPDG